MTEPMLERLREIAADILQLPADQISSESSPENVSSWDSVRHLDLVLALEQEFGLQFEPEEIDQMNDIRRISSILARKLNKS